MIYVYIYIYIGNVSVMTILKSRMVVTCAIFVFNDYTDSKGLKIYTEPGI